MSLHSSATIEVSDTGTISEADWEKAVSLAKRVVREDLAQQATKLRDRANQFLLEIGPLSEDEEGDSETAS